MDTDNIGLWAVIALAAAIAVWANYQPVAERFVWAF
jgi:hypothetical protein